MTHVADYVTVAAMSGATLYWIGAEEEFDWQAPQTWKAFSCKGGVSPSAVNISISATTPYSLFVDSGNLLLGDAGDYFNPGSVSLYYEGEKRWTVTAGVCPGHFAVW